MTLTRYHNHVVRSNADLCRRIRLDKLAHIYHYAAGRLKLAHEMGVIDDATYRQELYHLNRAAVSAGIPVIYV